MSETPKAFCPDLFWNTSYALLISHTHSQAQIFRLFCPFLNNLWKHPMGFWGFGVELSLGMSFFGDDFFGVELAGVELSGDDFFGGEVSCYHNF